MKCPDCPHNQKVREGMVCSGCGYRFTFNPKDPKTRQLTDGKFLAFLRRASRQDTCYFTQNQLYAAYAQKVPTPFWSVLTVALILAAFGYLFLSNWMGFYAAFLAMLGLFVLVAYFWKAPVVSPDRFSKWVAIWERDGKTLPRLLRQPELHQPPEVWPEDDLYDYGVEALLIVQRDLLVDLLVRNELHAQQRILVIAESGYPQYLVPRVQQLLNDRDDLPVYLLHDSDREGVRMAHRLRMKNWLPLKQHPVIDLGVFPEDFRKLKQTRHFDIHNRDRSLPVDALSVGSLGLGLQACLHSRRTFGQELAQEAHNQANAGSSFG